MFLFLWLASRGYHLRPWASPYLRWRVETYSGIPAESLTASTFLRFAWREREPLLAYLQWVSRNKHLLDRAD
jgi:hypothetical protein